jgi:recombination protein RecT
MNAVATPRENQIKSLMVQSQKQIKSLLGNKEKADKFMAGALQVATSYELSQCSPDSIVTALVSIAQLDLNPDKNIGQAYLIKYGNNATLQVGYRGYIQLLHRAGWLVKAYPVYDCDEFSMSFNGWENEVNIEPDFESRNDDDKEWIISHIRGVYVVARNSVTDEEYSDFVTKNVIEKSRKASQNQKGAKPTGVWLDWYAEMAKKSAIKKLAKLLPLSDTRASLAMAVDDRSEGGKLSRIEDGIILDVESEKTEANNDLNSIIVDQQTGEIKEPAQATMEMN